LTNLTDLPIKGKILKKKFGREEKNEMYLADPDKLIQNTQPFFAVSLD